MKKLINVFATLVVLVSISSGQSGPFGDPKGEIVDTAMSASDGLIVLTRMNGNNLYTWKKTNSGWWTWNVATNVAGIEGEVGALSADSKYVSYLSTNGGSVTRLYVRDWRTKVTVRSTTTVGGTVTFNGGFYGAMNDWVLYGRQSNDITKLARMNISTGQEVIDSENHIKSGCRFTGADLRQSTYGLVTIKSLTDPRSTLNGWNTEELEASSEMLWSKPSVEIGFTDRFVIRGKNLLTNAQNMFLCNKRTGERNRIKCPNGAWATSAKFGTATGDLWVSDGTTVFFTTIGLP